MLFVFLLFIIIDTKKQLLHVRKRFVFFTPHRLAFVMHICDNWTAEVVNDWWFRKLLLSLFEVGQFFFVVALFCCLPVYWGSVDWIDVNLAIHLFCCNWLVCCCLLINVSFGFYTFWLRQSVKVICFYNVWFAKYKESQKATKILLFAKSKQIHNYYFFFLWIKAIHSIGPIYIMFFIFAFNKTKRIIAILIIIFSE